MVREPETGRRVPAARFENLLRDHSAQKDEVDPLEGPRARSVRIFAVERPGVSGLEWMQCVPGIHKSRSEDHAGRWIVILPCLGIGVEIAEKGHWQCSPAQNLDQFRSLRYLNIRGRRRALQVCVDEPERRYT